MNLGELKNKKAFRYIILAFEIIAFLIVAYIFFAPLEPLARYEFFAKKGDDVEKASNVESATGSDAVKGLKESVTIPDLEINDKLGGDRLIIPKIGVNAYISKQIDSKKGLNEGVWLFPEGSRPDQGSNTTISGHRWKYLPPNNTTLYLLDKVAIGDKMYVRWKDKAYAYKVKEIKVVKPEDVYILNPTEKSTLTVYTCTPLYSQKNRLVVIGELIQ